MQCHYVNQKIYNELQKSNPDTAIEASRCKNEAVEGYTRCSEHGGSSLITFFSRGLKADQKLRFEELYNNILETYKLPTDNLLVLNLIAATCREIVTSHNADPMQHRGCINQALQYAKELNLTPRELKSKDTPDEEVEKEKKDIEAIVVKRLELIKQ